MYASRLSQQPYKYIIVLDFEATCWLGQPPAQYRNAEIIEFPAVLYNLETGTIVAEFQQYLKPTEKPQLSDYCLQLTGITQKTVDQGISLQKCLIMFEEWLRKELRSHQLQLPKVTKSNAMGNCAFVTWSECDLGIFLHQECIRKGIRKPTYFNQWIDMQDIFKKFTPRLKRSNFAYALDCMGLKFVGKEHSGLDDARNIAAFTREMIKKKGITLKITTDLTPSTWNLNYF